MNDLSSRFGALSQQISRAAHGWLESTIVHLSSLLQGWYPAHIKTWAMRPELKGILS